MLQSADHVAHAEHPLQVSDGMYIPIQQRAEHVGACVAHVCSEAPVTRAPVAH
jgi:hypothetical protein